MEEQLFYNVNPDNANCTVICPSSSQINAFGATSSVETKPQILEGNINIPNIFTPNVDGINDFFEPLSLLGIEHLQIDIVNRWGNLVYSQSSADGFKWDGHTNGDEVCSEGVYFYKISYSDYCNNEKVVTGFVQLVR